MSTHVAAEINTQPATWTRAIRLAAEVGDRLPAAGERVAVVGCGTSWFMAMSYAALREESGAGETDAFSGSEMTLGRTYDRVLAITRSGTTTEIVTLLQECELRSTPTTVVTAVADSPCAHLADSVVVLDFADEESVVQTRFATTALALLRAHLGYDLTKPIQDAQRALSLSIEDRADFAQVTFLGRGWTIGLAHEAALKTREAAQFWAESYPAMDYRHGPLAIAQEGRAVWSFGEPPSGLAGEVSRTGAEFVNDDLDPLAQLVVAQRLAVLLAERRGLDPDRPRNLTRAVHLEELAE